MRLFKFKNEICKKCGENFQKAKKAQTLRYWIQFRLPNGTQRKEYVGTSLTEAQASDGKRKGQKAENRILDMIPESDITFEELTKWYLDLAFRKATKAAKEVKGQKNRGPDTIKRAELAKIGAINRTLQKHFKIILISFPSIDTLPEFYQELVRTLLEYPKLKKSLFSLLIIEFF